MLDMNTSILVFNNVIFVMNLMILVTNILILKVCGSIYKDYFFNIELIFVLCFLINVLPTLVQSYTSLFFIHRGRSLLCLNLRHVCVEGINLLI